MHCLIVDDDYILVDEILHSMDWASMGITTLHTAYNVTAAKKILQEHPIDILLSDIEMPQETGLELLKFTRESGYDCEFIFLTCHENFEYAAHAINYHVAAYLTKPFNKDTLALTLHKTLLKLNQTKQLKQSSHYGSWLENNKKVVTLDFWRKVLEGEFLDKNTIEAELKNRFLDLSPHIHYGFVLTQVQGTEPDVATYGQAAYEFMLEGFQSEILNNRVENDCVVRLRSNETLTFVTVCEAGQLSDLPDRCDQLIEACSTHFRGVLTCCVSNGYPLKELSANLTRLKNCFDYALAYRGQVFHESEIHIPTDYETQMMDLKKLYDWVEAKDKTAILRYMKQLFTELESLKKLNLHSLFLLKEEFTQVLYTDMTKKGIQASKLFSDEQSIKLAEHATDSPVDMIRWINYMLEKTHTFEEELLRSATIIDRINDYIAEHFQEDIGRNEIAAAFYLTPEYLAKLYKKRTGNILKDALLEYRIEKAKELLRNGEINVSHVAEQVGFDNFSYFSTLFKKATGMTPKDYRSSC